MCRNTVSTAARTVWLDCLRQRGQEVRHGDAPKRLPPADGDARGVHLGAIRRVSIGRRNLLGYPAQLSSSRAMP